MGFNSAFKGLKDEVRGLLVFGLSLLFTCDQHVNSFAFSIEYERRRICSKINYGHRIQQTIHTKQCTRAITARPLPFLNVVDYRLSFPCLSWFISVSTDKCRDSAFNRQRPSITNPDRTPPRRIFFHISKKCITGSLRITM